MSNVSSIRVVKASEIPQRVTNTAMARSIADITEYLAKNGVPKAKDGGVSFTYDGAKKYTRYQLQKRLQKAGHKVNVLAGKLTAKDGTFFVVAAE